MAISSVEQVSPAWLTDALRVNGRLERGYVVAVQAQAVKSNTANARCHACP
jgi:hypothetical protein